MQWEKRDGGTEGRRRDFFTEEIETLKTDHVRSPRIKESDLAQQVRRDRHGTASATRPDEEPPGNSRKVARRTQPTCASTDVSTPSGPNVARDWEKFPCARTSHHVDELHRLAFSIVLGLQRHHDQDTPVSNHSLRTFGLLVRLVSGRDSSVSVRCVSLWRSVGDCGHCAA